MTYNSISAGSALGHNSTHASLNPSHAHSIAGWAKAPSNAPKRVRAFFATEDMKPGYRVPAVDVKIGKLISRVKTIQVGTDYFFPHIYADIAIEELGNYNPIYSGRPKKLALSLLSRVSMGRAFPTYSLINAGLMYRIPGLPGVRAERSRLTVAGWELLEHWAEKFPKFKLHWLAYKDNKAKKQIYSDCFDLALAHRPLSFTKIDAVQAAYTTRHESRLYRKMIKEQAAADKMKKQHAMQTLQQDMLTQQYRDQLNQQTMPMNPYFGTGNVGQQASTSGGFVSKTTAIIKGII